MTYAILLKSDERNLVHFIEKKPGLDFYYKTIGCNTIDIVPAYGLEGKTSCSVCLVVDDEGLLNYKKLNGIASIIYGIRRHGQPLVGDVLICKDVETPDGVMTEGFTKQELEEVWKAVMEAR